MADSAPASAAQTTQPPIDIRILLDTTASFVAKNGLRTEECIRVSNAGNPLFDFLNGKGPYHAYYQHQLSEFRAQIQTPSAAPADGIDSAD
ncbi:putative SWAP/Surp superfamily protein [Helianthus annuus]|nr:putative SWAP/Surp superfamily protein [Helianthus annuus]KAJ0658073.1 putative SWAP/Surp superfamily protein [Helianthus annuus]KAJ0661741.1 putative SWAP/Surp superfamily protein [Helianthus annuus]KAJ0842379.1 putative SWAP/Surp superfamily protein [Helianthus annuus]